MVFVRYAVREACGISGKNEGDTGFVDEAEAAIEAIHWWERLENGYVWL